MKRDNCPVCLRDVSVFVWGAEQVVGKHRDGMSRPCVMSGKLMQRDEYEVAA